MTDEIHILAGRQPPGSRLATKSSRELKCDISAAERSNLRSFSPASHLEERKSTARLPFLVFILSLRRRAWQVNLFSSWVAIPPVYSVKMSLYRDETGSLINSSGVCLNVIMGFGYPSVVLIHLH